MLRALGVSRRRIALVLTGGGAGTIGRCFRREGASRSFVEAVIPYSRAAVAEYLGRDPAAASASDSVARQLAAVAFARANRLGDDLMASDAADSTETAGVALVAALPTTPPRRGDDRIHVVLHTSSGGVLWSLELPKHAHTRESAETIADEMVYAALAELIGSEPNQRFFDDAGVDLSRVVFDP